MKKTIAIFLTIVMIFTLMPAQSMADESVVFSGVDTVMIYNPSTTTTSTMYTGDMTGQIKTTTTNNNYRLTNKKLYYFGDEYEIIEEVKDIKPNNQHTDVVDEINASYVDAKVDDTNTFFYKPSSSYVSGTFTCLYSGTYCQVWGYNYADKVIAGKMGAEFDNKIYSKDVDNFGSARYLEDGKKLNILIYPMSKSGLCGFFSTIELYEESEAPSYKTTNNLGQAIIHINSGICVEDEYDSVGYVTIAHEFQHLINFTSFLKGNNGSNRIGSWLNEAMSMQAEELIYPGEISNMGYISDCYNTSDLIANGQSLYTFTTSGYDIGVYGQVFIFSEYLKKQSSSEIFKNIHNYWRGSGTKSDAKCLNSIMPQSYKTALNSIVVYNSSTESVAGDDNNIFLSKMNLAFQIACVAKEDDGVFSIGTACGATDPQTYTGSSCNIDGGGRIIVKTNDGSTYTVPQDANDNLIYVGFKNGQMTIPPTTAHDYSINKYSVSAISNDDFYGKVTCQDGIITAVPYKGYTYGSPAYTVTEGTATVKQSGNSFVVYPTSNCTVQINFAPRSTESDIWDGSVATSLPLSGSTYSISTCAELAKFGQMVNAGTTFEDKKVVLTKNLNLNNLSWTCIGTSTTNTFKGVFDGGEYTISNLAVGTSSSHYAEGSGLFGFATGATIKNVVVENASVYGSAYSSILVGKGENCQFDNCRVSGTVASSTTNESHKFIGGIVGDGPANISKCYADVIVSGYEDMGCIVGRAKSSEIVKCEGHGTVSGEWCIGGIAGETSSTTTIYSSWSDATLGLTKVDDSYNGGIVGYCIGGLISKCYFSGNSTGRAFVGGIVGYATYGATITECYSSGTLNVSQTSRGMIVGAEKADSTQPTYSSCYYNNSISTAAVNNAAKSGCTGLSAIDCKDSSKYAGWDFTETWCSDSDVNGGLPFLRWQIIDVASVGLSAESDSINVGDSISLTTSVLPAAATDKRCTYSSSDTSVATVTKDGVVTGLSAGTTTITVTTANNKKEDSVEITVIGSAPEEFGIGQATATVNANNVEFKISVLAPTAASANLVVAAYKDGQQKDLTLVKKSVSVGINKISVSISYNSGWTYRAFLMGGESFEALSQSKTLTVN